MVNLPYKIDKTYFSSQYGTYQVFQNWTVTLTISGTIPNNFANIYTADFSFPVDNAKARVFIQRHDGSLKTTYDTGTIAAYIPTYQVYQFAGSEVVQTDIRYTSGGDILTVYFAIVNRTGGVLNLIAQSLDIIVGLYDGPVA